MLRWDLFPQAKVGANITGYAQRFGQARVLCVGDVMLDCYVQGAVTRISPEAPVPVVEIEEETWTLGGMANASANAASLGAQVFPVGVIGNDAAGERLRAEFRARGLPDSGLVCDAGRQTTVKTRIGAGSQQIVRMDREVRTPICGSVENQMIQTIRDQVRGMNAVLICDYAKGALTPAVLSETIQAAHWAGIPVCLDPKRPDFIPYRGATLVTPNLKEAGAYSGVEIESIEDVAAAAGRLMRAADCEYVVITLGAHGMLLAGGPDAPLYVPSRSRQVFDVGGAGDTAIATLALSLAAGAPVSDAMYLANAAAGVAVQKRGTAVIEITELLSELAEPSKHEWSGTSAAV